MKNFSQRGLIACLCLSLSLSPGLWAQDSDTWQWRVIAYLWGLDYSENKNSLNARAALDATMYGFLVGYEFN